MEVKTILKRVCFVILTLIISAIAQIIMNHVGIADDVRNDIMVPLTTIGLVISMELWEE